MTQKHIEEFLLYKMNKLAVPICLLFVVVYVVGGSRSDSEKLPDWWRKFKNVKIKNTPQSSENTTCSSNDDCWDSCCKNGKCGPPLDQESKEECEETLISIIIGAVVSVAIIIAIVVLVIYCCRRRSSVNQ